MEAAIGIEPMNKGFAVLARLFAQVQPCFLVSQFHQGFRHFEFACDPLNVGLL